MKARTLLEELITVTDQIEAQLARVSPEMKHNDPDEVEALQAQIERRAETLARLDEVYQAEPITWSAEEKELIRQLQEKEKQLHGSVTALYHSFVEQIRQLEQGKQASVKYGQGYQANADGAFFDQRK